MSESETSVDAKSTGHSESWKEVLLWLSPLMLIAYCGGLGELMVIPTRIMLGWFPFLQRVLADVRVDLPQVAFAIGLAIAIASLGDWVLRTIFVVRKRRRRYRMIACGIMLTLSLFAIGLGATGFAHQSAWLLTAEEPFWRHGRHRIVRRAASQNNEKNMGVAFYRYASDNEAQVEILRRDINGKYLHGWQTAMLPYMDRQRLYEQIEQAQPWNAPINRHAVEVEIPEFRIPGVRPVHHDGFALSHYAANAWLLESNDVRRYVDVADGTTGLILVGEVSGGFLPWSHPLNVRDPMQGINQGSHTFGCPSAEGCHVLMADGSVVFLDSKIDPAILALLSKPSDMDAEH